MIFGSTKRPRSVGGVSHPSEVQWNIAREDKDDRGCGWVAFAGSLLLILGVLNLIEGLAAVGDTHFFVRNTNDITGSFHTWGWVVVCIGVLDLVVGCGVS